jgi:hypothetical protein
MGWVRNVVLMNVYFGSGKPQGVGISSRGGARWGKCKGQFTSNPRKKWTDPVTARRVPSKWKGEQGDHRVHNLSILCILYNGTNAVVNDTSCTLYNNNNRNECC